MLAVMLRKLRIACERAAADHLMNRRCAREDEKERQCRPLGVDEGADAFNIDPSDVRPEPQEQRGRRDEAQKHEQDRPDRCSGQSRAITDQQRRADAAKKLAINAESIQAHLDQRFAEIRIFPRRTARPVAAPAMRTKMRTASRRARWAGCRSARFCRIHHAMACQRNRPDKTDPQRQRPGTRVVMMRMAELDVDVDELLQRQFSAAMKLQIRAGDDVKQARYDRCHPGPDRLRDVACAFPSDRAGSPATQYSATLAADA